MSGYGRFGAWTPICSGEAKRESVMLSRWTRGPTLTDQPQGPCHRQVAMVDTDYDPQTAGLPCAPRPAKLVRTFALRAAACVSDSSMQLSGTLLAVS